MPIASSTGTESNVLLRYDMKSARKSPGPMGGLVDERPIGTPTATIIAPCRSSSNTCRRKPAVRSDTPAAERLTGPPLSCEIANGRNGECQRRAVGSHG